MSAQPDHIAFLALGSNLGAPALQFVNAVRAVTTFPGTHLLRKSSLYQSAAWGASTPQPDYLNAVIQIATDLTPLQLLRHTAALEVAQGRVRDLAERNAARTLDIDLLLYDDVVLNTEELALPHPRMHERAFVLCPLVEIAPEIEVPGHGRASSLLSRISTGNLTKIGNNSAWN